jgi:PIN domain nuclease of toxin-antitoxin system
MIMLDTHVAVALYEGRSGGLGPAARRAIDREPAALSPAVLLEIELLHEIGRLREGARTISTRLAEDLAIRVANERFAHVALEALRFGFTRDPFDRLIVAHASVMNAGLITQDTVLRCHYAKAMG